MGRIIPKDRISSKKIDSVKQSGISDGRNQHLLQECSRLWDQFEQFRKTRERNQRYLYGDQWSDKVDVDSHTITEREYIVSQGNIPLTNNLIRRLVRNIMGVYRQQMKEPVCVARDRDEQSLGEMMTATLQCNFQLNKLSEVDARSFEEYLTSGLIIQKEFYGWQDDKYECWTNFITPERIFFDSPAKDIRHMDTTMIGEIHDIPFLSLCSVFAHSPNDYARLYSIYQNRLDTRFTSGEYFGIKRQNEMNFFVSKDPSLCRVIEVWTKEQKVRYRCHDYLKGEWYKVEESELSKINQENQSRIQEGIQQGLAEDNIPLIEYEWFVDTYWYYRFLSPWGNVLKEGETPYKHKSHPYIFKAYPFIDGKIHSFVADVIDQQKYINRMITLNDWMIRASAKGVLLVPEDSIPDDMSPESFSEEWAKFNGVIVYKPKMSVPPPTQISKNSTNIGTHEMLALQMRMMEDISGVHGALQGKSAGSGVSGTLYAQQVQNSATSLVDLLESFSSFTSDRSLKKLKNIQQYYDTKKTIAIAGTKGRVLQYDPAKITNIEFDISIAESTSTPAYRMIANDFLMKIWESGQISLEMLLENGTLPFADSLLQSLRSEQNKIKNGDQDGFSAGVKEQVMNSVDPEKMALIEKLLKK